MGKARELTQLEKKIQSIELDAIVEKLKKNRNLQMESEDWEDKIDLSKKYGKVLPVPLNTQFDIRMSAVWLEGLIYTFTEFATKLWILLNVDLVGDAKKSLVKEGYITQEELDNHAMMQLTGEDLIAEADKQELWQEENIEQEVSTEESL